MLQIPFRHLALILGLEYKRVLKYKEKNGKLNNTISINNYTINCCPEEAQSKRLCYRRGREIIAHVQLEMV